MENNHDNDEMMPGGPEADDTLLARWLAGDLSAEDLEALRNLEEYPDYVEMLHTLEGMEMPEFSPTLAWQKLQLAVGSWQLAARAEEAQRAEEEAKSQQSAVSSLPAGAGQQPAQADGQEGDAANPLPTAAGPAATPPIAKQGKLPFDAPQNTEAKLVEIGARQAANPMLIRKSPIVNPQWLAIAAALLIGVVGLWWLFGRDQFSFTDTDYATKAGEKKEVKLPDGSVATLNAMSKLGFTASDWEDGRKVVLEGEAYFKAKKGKTFSVRTEQGTVQVVGTVFNVYARGGELEVKCAEGKVQVINPDDTERVLLKKGEQVSVLGGKMQKREGLSFYPNWFKGESAFRSEPLENVFGEMERQYGVVVLADSLAGRTFSGKFLHGDLKKAVKMVCDPMKLRCEVRGDSVLVR